MHASDNEFASAYSVFHAYYYNLTRACFLQIALETILSPIQIHYGYYYKAGYRRASFYDKLSYWKFYFPIARVYVQQIFYDKFLVFDRHDSYY